MPLARRLSLLPLVSVSLVAGCGEPTAPTASEALAVHVSYRLVTDEERLPSVRVTTQAGAVTIHVSRAASCAMLVGAQVARGRRTLAVVAKVAGDPAVSCIESGSLAVDYSATVAQVARGSWTVRVFEAFGEGAPRLLRERHVRVATVSPN